MRIQEKMIQETPSQEESYSIGLPIPGFEVDVVRPKAESRPLTESNPVSPRTMQSLEETSLEERSEEKEVVDKVLSRTRPSRAIVKRMELALILQEGAAPELIENIRQLTMAASKFDNNRTTRLQFPENYHCTVRIAKAEKGPKGETSRVSTVHVLQEVFPYAVEAIPLSFGSSQLVKCTANFYYSKHRVAYNDQGRDMLLTPSN